MQLVRHQFVDLKMLDVPDDPPPLNEMVLEVAAAELRALRGSADGQRRSVHSAVEKDVQELLQGKDGAQLADMEADIEKNIAQGKTRDLVGRVWVG